MWLYYGHFTNPTPHAILSVGSWIKLGVVSSFFSKCGLDTTIVVSSFGIGVESLTYEKSKPRLSFSSKNHIHPPNCVHKGTYVLVFIY